MIRPKAPLLIACPRCHRPQVKREPGAIYECCHCGTRFELVPKKPAKKPDTQGWRPKGV